MKKKSNYNKFLLLWAGELVSSIGGGLTSFGLGVYVFNITRSAGSMAIVTLLAFLPTLLLSVPAGVLADKYDRRLMMMLGDGLSAIGLIYILVCMLLGNCQLYQICIGVFISSVFSSLLEPSYRATVTDLLTQEEYSKASGMVNIAGSARYLLSPVIAGFLLSVSDIKLILVIDICTFVLTVITTMVVKKAISEKKVVSEESFIDSFKDGLSTLTSNRGVMELIIVSAIMTCFVGAIQMLSEPMVLDFASSSVLGTCETICALGMLVSSIFLGIKGIKKNYVFFLSVSLSIAGIAMILFGLKENIILICVSGFVFFLMLPFANNSLDCLVRTNIAAEKQGRIWGLIGFISQLGYVIAYGAFGILADGIAKKMNIGVGRGAAMIIICSGILLTIVSVVAYFIKDIRGLENS